jgi:hypothetical protein
MPFAGKDILSEGLSGYGSGHRNMGNNYGRAIYRQGSGRRLIVILFLMPYPIRLLSRIGLRLLIRILIISVLFPFQHTIGS